jgi:hypothetical protein
LSLIGYREIFFVDLACIHASRSLSAHSTPRRAAGSRRRPDPRARFVERRRAQARSHASSHEVSRAPIRGLELFSASVESKRRFVVPDRLDRLERVRPWVRAPPRRGTPPPRRPRTRLTPLRPPGRRRRPRAPRWTRRLVAPSDADLIREMSTRVAAPWTGPKIRRSLARVAPRLA